MPGVWAVAVGKDFVEEMTFCLLFAHFFFGICNLLLAWNHLRAVMGGNEGFKSSSDVVPPWAWGKVRGDTPSLHPNNCAGSGVSGFGFSQPWWFRKVVSHLSFRSRLGLGLRYAASFPALAIHPCGLPTMPV